MDGMTSPSMAMPHEKMTMMHMTFFWGKDVEILFSGWPRLLALFFVFALSVALEWFSVSHFIKPGSNRFSTGLYAVRMGLAYMVMLAVMSFNGGVLIVAVIGHALGFFLFGSRVFNRFESEERNQNNYTELPPAKV